MVDFKRKEHYDMQDLLHIVEILRDPVQGCPWDSVQTHESVRMNFVEETYEVLDAIDQKDAHLLCEELGDVLLHVLFHTRIEEEQGHFDFAQVCDSIAKKLVGRHPHIFGSDDPAALAADSWDALKNLEKSRTTAKDEMESVPTALPALMRAAKIQKRASRYGYAGHALEDAFKDLAEETAELHQAITDQENIEGEMGDVLFAAVMVSRALEIDPEQALDRASTRFADRLIRCEKMALQAGQDLKALDYAHRRALWQQAKKQQYTEGK